MIVRIFSCNEVVSPLNSLNVTQTNPVLARLEMAASEPRTSFPSNGRILTQMHVTQTPHVFPLAGYTGLFPDSVTIYPDDGKRPFLTLLPSLAPNRSPRLPGLFVMVLRRWDIEN